VPADPPVLNTPTANVIPPTENDKRMWSETGETRSRVIINPYATTPIGERMFYGRSEDMTYLQTHGLPFLKNLTDSGAMHKTQNESRLETSADYVKQAHVPLSQTTRRGK